MESVWEIWRLSEKAGITQLDMETEFDAMKTPTFSVLSKIIIILQVKLKNDILKPNQHFSSHLNRDVNFYIYSSDEVIADKLLTNKLVLIGWIIAVKISSYFSIMESFSGRTWSYTPRKRLVQLRYKVCFLASPDIQILLECGN